MPTYTAKQNFVTATDMTITLASLASDTNLLAGREATAIDTRTNGYADYLVSGKITTGTSPTVNRSIEIWFIGWDGSGWPDVFDGTDSDETISLSNVKNAICRFCANITITATSNEDYYFGPVSVAQAFGGRLPGQFTVFVVHNAGSALNATAGNHFIRVQAIYDTIS